MNVDGQPPKAELDPQSALWLAKAAEGSPPYSRLVAGDLILLSVVRGHDQLIRDKIAMGTQGFASWRVVNTSFDQPLTFRIDARLWRASCEWDRTDPRVHGDIVEIDDVVPCRAAGAVHYPCADFSVPFTARALGANALITNCTGSVAGRVAAPSLYSSFTMSTSYR